VDDRRQRQRRRESARFARRLSSATPGSGGARTMIVVARSPCLIETTITYGQSSTVLRWQWSCACHCWSPMHVGNVPQPTRRPCPSGLRPLRRARASLASAPPWRRQPGVAKLRRRAFAWRRATSLRARDQSPSPSCIRERLSHKSQASGTRRAEVGRRCSQRLKPPPAWDGTSITARTSIAPPTAQKRCALPGIYATAS
jgi:hypothetical protein